MSVPDWPETLPQVLLVEGYQGSPPDLMLRSPMEVGPAKQRRRSTAGVQPVKGKINVTAAKLQDLIEFYNDDLLSGSLRFNWVDPLDGVTAVEMRFAEKPAWISVEPDSYDVSLSLEVLP